MTAALSDSHHRRLVTDILIPASQQSRQNLHMDASPKMLPFPKSLRMNTGRLSKECCYHLFQTPAPVPSILRSIQNHSRTRKQDVSIRVRRVYVLGYNEAPSRVAAASSSRSKLQVTAVYANVKVTSFSFPKSSSSSSSAHGLTLMFGTACAAIISGLMGVVGTGTAAAMASDELGCLLWP